MKEIRYLKGDATIPYGKGDKIIAHVCNDLGGWGKGFVVAVSRRWKEPEKEYREWYKEKNNFQLGEVQFVCVEMNITVANMIAQHGIRGTSKEIPLRYDALEKCLEKVGKKAIEKNASVHMPRIGCGLARGKWETVEVLVRENFSKNEIAVYIYDLE